MSTTQSQDEAVARARLRHGPTVGPPPANVLRRSHEIRLHAVRAWLEEAERHDAVTAEQLRTLRELSLDIRHDGMAYASDDAQQLMAPPAMTKEREWAVRDATVFGRGAAPILRYIETDEHPELPTGRWEVVRPRMFVLRAATVLLIGCCAALEILVGLGIIHHGGV